MRGYRGRGVPDDPPVHRREEFIPCRGRSLVELVVFVAGGAHWVEWCAGSGWGLAQCSVASTIAATYALFTAGRTRGVLAWWGVRFGGAIGGAFAAGLFTLIAYEPAVWLGESLRAAGLPRFAVTPCSYLAWCVTQDFILCCFLAAHFDELLPSRVLAAMMAGGLFGLGHVPHQELAWVTFAAGSFWAWLFLLTRSIWPIVAMHWILGLALLRA